MTLSGGWREGNLSWRASSWWGLRHGLQLEALSAAQKQSRGLAADATALVVKGMFNPRTEVLKKAGLKVGDIIIGVDDRSNLATESQFLAHIRLTHGPGERMRLLLLRGSEKVPLEVPMW
jgi:S1-C subfamily serine protease